jgi:hypothetical protein
MTMLLLHIMLNALILSRFPRQRCFRTIVLHMSDTDGSTKENGVQPHKSSRPECQAEFNTLFDKHAHAINTAKQLFMEEIGAQALTLSPKDAFEGRMRCLHFLHPHLRHHEWKKDEESDQFEYRIISNGIYDKDEDIYDHFLADDDRYKVHFEEDVGSRDFKHCAWYQEIYLTIYDGEKDNEDNVTMDKVGKGSEETM